MLSILMCWFEYDFFKRKFDKFFVNILFGTSHFSFVLSTERTWKNMSAKHINVH